ncbi:hypothetical protein [Plantactinospora sp. B24E8]|uniref:hypothetical protein n=1 Tax=Plantactinospora sp. B24E8 TaxID=3153567 RepID=UPI00325C5034
MDETGQPGAPTPGDNGNGAGPQGDQARPINGWAADAGWPGAENGGDASGRQWRQPAEPVLSQGWGDRSTSYPTQPFPGTAAEHRQPVNGVHLGEAAEAERGWAGGRGEPGYPYGPEPTDPYVRRSPVPELPAGPPEEYPTGPLTAQSPDGAAPAEPARHAYSEREPGGTLPAGQPPRWGESGYPGHPGPISGPPAAAVSGPPVPASAPPMQVSGPPAQISVPPANPDRMVRERTALMPAVPRPADRVPGQGGPSGHGQTGTPSGAWPAAHPVDRGALPSGPGAAPAGPGYPPGEPGTPQGGAGEPDGAWSSGWAPPWAAPSPTPTSANPVDPQPAGHGVLDPQPAGHGPVGPHTAGPASLDPHPEGPGPVGPPATSAPAGPGVGGPAAAPHAAGLGHGGDQAEPAGEFRDGGHRRDVEPAPDQGWSPPGWANQRVQRLPVQRPPAESPLTAVREVGHRDDQPQPAGYDDRGQSGGYDDQGQRSGYDDRGEPRGYDEHGQRFRTAYDEHAQRVGHPVGPAGPSGADPGSHRVGPEDPGQHGPVGPVPAQHPEAPGYLPGPGGLRSARAGEPTGHPPHREALALPTSSSVAGPAYPHQPPSLSAAEPGSVPRPAEQGLDALPQRIPAEPDVPTVPEPPAVEPPAETPELARIATHLRREDGPVQPRERPDGFDVEAIVAAVQGVPGVRDASVRTTPAGAHSLRLDLADGADPAEVSRQVARLLQERMGLAAAPQNLPDTAPVDPTRPGWPGSGASAPGAPPRQVPTAAPRQPGTYGAPAPTPAPGAFGGPTGPGTYGTATEGARRRRPAPARGRASAEQPEGATPTETGRSGGLGATTVGTSYSGSPVTTTESAPSRPLNPGSPPGPRVIIDHVQVSTFGLDATVEVRLAAGDQPAAGLATGPAVDGYVLRLCAVAAAAAIDELLSSSTRVTERGRCFVEHAAVVPFGSCEVATVVVLLVCDGWVEQLAGSALVAGDPRQAVVRATLSAVNRRLEALLT